MRKHINTILKSIVCGAGLLTIASAGSFAETLRLAHTLPTQHPVHKAMVYMDDRLQFHSDGKMDITIYPSAQLGTEREVIELLQIGSLSMTKVSAASMEAFVPAMKIFGLPYVFRSKEHFWNTLNSDLGESLLDEGIPYRVKGLGYFDAGSRSFYSTKKPITSPEDLRGMKIRVMSSQTAVNMVRSMGGSPTPVSFGELYTALQQGVVDGAENNPPSFYASKHYEVAKYYILDEHTSIPDVIVIGTHSWNRLSSQQQEWLQTAMDESTEYQRQLWAEYTEHALREVKKAGVTVIKAEKPLFQESVEEMVSNYKGSKIGDLVEQIQKIGG